MHLTRVLQPQLCISLAQVARFLGIAQSSIHRIEHWMHVLFVHRADQGGQFISYRKFAAWIEACARTILSCNDLRLLEWLGQVIKAEVKRFAYPEDVLVYWRHLWQRRYRELQPQQSTV